MPKLREKLGLQTFSICHFLNIVALGSLGTLTKKTSRPYQTNKRLNSMSQTQTAFVTGKSMNKDDLCY